jgi:hypothetical protein
MVSVAKRWLFFTLALGLTGFPHPARAQTASAAEMLFEEGRRLMDAGDYAVGCAKLAESQRLDPAGGTLMNLAACHERAGKTATAWAEFNDALAQARRDGRQDRVAEATRRIAEIVPRLPRVSVFVGSPTLPGLEVRLDGTILGAPSWGTLIPVDPGEHELRAIASGCLPWSERTSIEGGTTKVLPVPVLQPKPASAENVDSSSERSLPTSEHPLRTAGLVLGSVGVASFGLGAAFGFVAAGKKHDSESQCSPSGNTCNTVGAGLMGDANTAAWVSDIGFGVGAATLAIATYFFFATSHRADTRTSLIVTPLLGVNSIGLGTGGAW